MTSRIRATTLAVALACLAAPALADEMADKQISTEELNINGDTPVTTVAPAAEFLKGPGSSF